MKNTIKHMLLLLGATSFALFSVSCGESDQHSHDEHADHDEHAGHDDDSDHAHGDEDHDEHADHDDDSDHAHGDEDHDEHADHDDDSDHAHGEKDHAEEGEHGHDHAHIEVGPNGGRLLTAVEPHLEFLVTEDRKVKISSISEENAVQPIGTQVVTVMGGDRSSPTRMKFAKAGDSLISDVAFPEGNDFPVVIQIKATADAEAVTEKFNLNLEECPTCSNKEYACTCEH